MDELEKKSDEDLERIVLAGVNLLPHIPQSESNRAKRILEYRQRQKMNKSTKKSEKKIQFVQELTNLFSSLDVKKLYEEPDHKVSKDWLADVAAILKNLDETDYREILRLSKTITPAEALEKRKSAAHEIDSFVRRKVAEYKRMDFSNLDDVQPNTEKLTAIRIFLSYSSKNKIGVGKIKAYLSNFGFEVFLAHEDIEPSLEWRKVITKKLKECHIFIPVITPEFNKSIWTDQESGMAYIEEKLIIPVSTGSNLNPRGFLAIYQSLPMNPSKVWDGCERIVRTIKNDPRFSSFVLSLLLEKLRTSKSYAEAERNMSLIEESTSWMQEQFDLLLKYAIENNQVHYAGGVRVALPELIKKYKQLVDPALLQKLNTIDQDFKFG